MYYVTTTDFATFSKAKLLYDHDFSVIDAFIIRDGARHVMFLKDETERPPQKNIRLAYSERPEGPWTRPTTRITGDYWAEGPTVLRVGNRWIVYFDRYREHRYGALASTDLQHVGRRHRAARDARRHPSRHGVPRARGRRASASSHTTADDGAARMIRKAFRMAVNPSEYEEYERRHSPIWEELQEVLRAHGAHDYSIFLDDTDGSLFGYVEIEDEARWDAIAEHRRVPPVVDVHARHHAHQPRRQPAQPSAARGVPPRLTTSMPFAGHHARLARAVAAARRRRLLGRVEHAKRRHDALRVASAGVGRRGAAGEPPLRRARRSAPRATA